MRWIWDERSISEIKRSLIGDKAGFDRVCPDGTRGAIAWNW